jgi:superfamily II DNA/RNA helicase
MEFSQLGLSPKVLAAIAAAGYAEPTPIQARAIPPAIAGKDVLGIAQTGTGKTAGFVLPMLTRLEQGRARARMPRSLIICPTRELAAQVAESFERYGVNHKLTLALLIGGVSFEDQYRKLDRGVDVLIATPGRLLDHFQRGKLLLTGVELLVIDEADRMLDMGFIPDIERICSLLPPKRQTLFFSATMPPEIQRLVDRFLKSPERVEVARQSSVSGTITQQFAYSAPESWDKREALRNLIRSSGVRNAIIFCNRKRDVDILHKSLVKHGFHAACLHGDMDQHSRTTTLDGFRSGNVSLLVASDVAARGLDIPDVSHVFNFDVPIQAEDYVHRIGRTGRAGRTGHSFTIVTEDDLHALAEITKLTRQQPDWIGEPPPADAGTRPRRRRGGRGRHIRAGAAGHRDASGPRGARPQAEKAANKTSGEPASRPRQGPQAETRTDQPRVSTKPGGRGAGARAALHSRSHVPKHRHVHQHGNRDQDHGRTRSSRGDDGPPVVGLGDHLPDFLKRPVR